MFTITNTHVCDLETLTKTFEEIELKEIKQLRIDGWIVGSQLKEKFLELLSNASTLNTLYLVCDNYGMLETCSLALIQNKNIDFLILSQLFDHKKAKMFFGNLQKTKITKLHFVYFRFYYSDALKEFTDYLKETKLTYLFCEGDCYDGDRVIDALQENKHLRKLILSGIRTNYTNNLDSLAKIISYNTITQLSFDGFPRNQDHSKFFLALKSNSSLTYLSLDSGNINDEDLVLLSDSLVNSNLKYLVITHHSKEEARTGHSRYLSSFLTQSKSLIRLTINKCKLDDVYLKSLIESLKSNTTVVKLDLSATQLENNAIPILEELVKSNPRITKIKLDFNNFDKNLIKNHPILKLQKKGKK